MTQHELDVICRNGEGQEVEFKRNLNSDLSKELVAFANAVGGRIFIGIDDNCKVVGLHIDNDLKARVEVAARDCDPAVAITLEVFQNILIVHVPEGKNKPHRCTNGFYRRVGASSLKLTTAEIFEFGRSEGLIRFDKLPVPSINLETDLDKKALKRFIQLSGISPVIDSTQMLSNLGVLSRNNTSTVLNNTGALFFSKEPAQFLPHAVISCVLFKGYKKSYIIDRKILEFDLLTNIDKAVAFLELNLKLAYEIKDIRRKEILEIPKHVLREAVINACAHRDYFEEGANVVIEIFDDRVQISNPGGLPKGLKPQFFGRLSIARNGLIVNLLNRCDYIERAGTGIRRMRDGMREAGLSEPIFEFSEFFIVTFYRNKPLTAKFANELNVRQDKLRRIVAIVQLLHIGAKLDIERIAKDQGTTARNIRKDLELLQEKGWIISDGVTKGKSYRLTDLGKQSASSIENY